MLRTVGMLLVLSGLLSLSGCGKSNDAITQELLSKVNSMSDALENGDKARFQESLNNLSTFINKELKNRKLSKTEKKELDEKYLPQIKEASTRLKNAMQKALASGKITPQDVMSLANTIKELN